jgi:hypothetical protein
VEETISQADGNCITGTLDLRSHVNHRQEHRLRPPPSALILFFPLFYRLGRIFPSNSRLSYSRKNFSPPWSYCSLHRVSYPSSLTLDHTRPSDPPERRHRLGTTMDSPRGGSPRAADFDHEPRDSSSLEIDPKPKQLPDDLPKSLDDRRSFPGLQPETEMYDAWQGVL